MDAKKSKPLTLAHMLREPLRNHSGRNERLYVREGSSDPKLRGAIVDELASLAEAKIRHNEVQRANAMKPRGGDDKRTASQLVADVVKGHSRDAKADDLIQHVHAAREANGMRPITDKWAKELIGREQSARKRRTPRT